MAVARYDSMNDSLTDGMTDGRKVKKCNPDRGGIVEGTTARMREDTLGHTFGTAWPSYFEGAEKEEYYKARPDLPHTVPDPVPDLPVENDA